MLTLGGLTFLSPWLLAALAAIPVLWWILRVMPPRPRGVKFPAFFLLKDLRTDMKTAAHTPWWLLLLRSAVVACVILAFADPVLRLSGALPGGDGPLLIAVDNGWAAAAHWNERVDKLKEYAAQAKRENRPVIFAPTAPEAQDGKVHIYGPMEAADAEKFVAHLKAWPWPPDRAAAAEAMRGVVDRAHPTYAAYLSDGTAAAGDTELFLVLGATGGFSVVADDTVNAPVILRRPPAKPGVASFALERLAPAAADRPMALVAYSAQGNALDNLKFAFPGGKTETSVTWGDMLSGLRSKIARFAVERAGMASAVSLTDSQWQQHPVGIVADPARKDNESFLNEVYYLRRALEGNGAPEIDQPGALLDKSLSAMIWPDSAALTSVERNDLLTWVQGGGFLIRFAGPNLAASAEDDPLLPVKLRFGERAMEGAMTWEKPAKLGPLVKQSPLYGLSVPKDVTVARQLLADPTPEVFERTWLQLEDGTPLITGGNVGKGFVVLIHTSAGPDWSDFCYSGLYVEALQRMIALSAGIGSFKPETVLPPLLIMDGQGRLQPPDRNSVAGPVDPAKDFVPSPATPPGLYGYDRAFRVFNLGDALSSMRPQTGVPHGADKRTYALSGEKSLTADFLSAALWLLALDTLLTLWLRGALGGAAAVASLTKPLVRGGLVLLILLGAVQAARAEGEVGAAGTDPAGHAGSIYFGYVETGDRDADQVSLNGLSGLMRRVNQRTTIRVRGVDGVNLEADALYFYPFLYWPMTEGQAPLSTAAARNVQNYLAQGGLILFDTRDQQFASPSGQVEGATLGARRLRGLTRNIQIPELMPVESGHILGKTFYLLDSFPGLYAGGKLWAEKEPNPAHDSVTSVLIGGNDWAAAWSENPSDRSRFLVVPGGEQQREMAYRFGVNLSMMALAGNYKSDQVHVPYILQRLNRQ
jgi:hypothetical protein